MGDAKRPFFKDLGSQKGGEGSRNEVIVGLGIWLGVRLKRFICAQSVSCAKTISMRSLSYE